jgi:hypothetical protein
MVFAKRVFTAAGIYGIVVLAPLYFLEDWFGRGAPPAITHPEFFFGFVGIALAWQFVFLVIGRDPLRYQPLILPSILEKLSYGVAVIILFLLGRVVASTLVTACIDLVLGTLFVAAYLATRPHQPTTQP